MLNQELTKQELASMIGSFIYGFGNTFLITTRKGNFIWSDPSYDGGTGIIKPFNGTYSDYLFLEEIDFGRDKGEHYIGDYCGDFTYVVEDSFQKLNPAEKLAYDAELNIPCTKAQLSNWSQNANDLGISLSDWVRIKLDRG